MKNRLIALVIVCITPLLAQERRLIDISPASVKAINPAFLTQLDIASQQADGSLHLLISPEDEAALTQAGIDFDFLPELEAQHITDSEYHTYEEIVFWCQTMASSHSEICQLQTIGLTQKNLLPIPALKISDHPDLEEEEPAILFDGQHHAREPISMEACIQIAERLLNDYGSSDRITRMVDETEIWIVPCLNPDGWKYMMDGHLSDPWWRKNLRDNDGNGAFSPYEDGVDLNRNYDAWWTNGIGEPGSWVYRGPSAFSESETRAKRDLTLEEQFVYAISYHSYGEILIFPYFFGSELAYDANWYKELADELCPLIPSEFTGRNYTVSLGTFMPNQGGLVGFSYLWMYTQAHVMEILIETGVSFVPPGEDGLRIAGNQVDAALALIDHLFGPGVSGRVTDSVTGDPVEASLTFGQIMNDRKPVRYSDAQFGRYYKPLYPNIQHRVVVNAPGYQTQTLLVDVNEGEWTPLDVSLVPVGSSVADPAAIPKTFALLPNSPNPFNPETRIEYHLPEAGAIELAVYNVKGQRVRILVSGRREAGIHHATWRGLDEEGRAVGSGVYFYRLTNGESVLSGKMMLMK